MTLLFLGEASPLIGTGHVVECFNLVRAAQRRNAEVSLFINEACPEQLLRNSPIPATVARDFSPGSLSEIAGGVIRVGETCVANFRKLSSEQIQALRRGFARLAAIDEFGQRRLEVDLVFNNTIIPEFHEYSVCDGRPRAFLGPAYLAMGEEFARLNRRPRRFSDGIRRIAITLGGVDRSRATVRILAALLEWGSSLQIDVILGSGFSDDQDLDAVMRNVQRHAVICHRSLPSIAELLANADLAFTSGGNTLYELSCVGTPAITVFDYPHERRQSEILSERGFGVCLGQGQEVKSEMVLAVLERFAQGEERRRHSDIGRDLVDGQGAERTVDILLAA